MHASCFRRYVPWLAAMAILCLAGCDRGPERRLRGRWQLDIEATVEAIREQQKGKVEEGTARHALTEALLASFRMQQRELIFSRDGSVRAVLRGHPGRIPWPGAGALLHEERALWTVTGADENKLTVWIRGGEHQLTDREIVIFFENKDRFYFYTGAEGEVREYWIRQ